MSTAGDGPEGEEGAVAELPQPASPKVVNANAQKTAVFSKERTGVCVADYTLRATLQQGILLRP